MRISQRESLNENLSMRISKRESLNENLSMRISKSSLNENLLIICVWFPSSFSWYSGGLSASPNWLEGRLERADTWRETRRAANSLWDCAESCGADACVRRISSVASWRRLSLMILFTSILNVLVYYYCCTCSGLSTWCEPAENQFMEFPDAHTFRKDPTISIHEPKWLDPKTYFFRNIMRRMNSNFQ